VVQAALKLVIEPIFEHEFEPRSYGFRPGLGCKDALREVDQHLKAGYCWVVDADAISTRFHTYPFSRKWLVELRTAGFWTSSCPFSNKTSWKT
jgi:RNA-directed DNA polymerase